MYYYTVCFSLLIYKIVIQGDSGGKADILEGESIGHCEKKIIYEHLSNSELLPR
jgi:hypothetical protein